MKILVLSALLVSTLLNAKDFTNSIGIKFKEIPSGFFIMGTKPPKCPKDDPFTSKNEYKDCINGTSISSDEPPYHKIRVKSFYMATTEVTQLQYYKIMGENPAKFKTEKLGYDSRNNPIEYVSWDDAKRFVKKLNQKEGTNKYRLPTEEEWGYSARAGSQSKWSFGNNKSELKNYAWYYENSRRTTHPVAKKKPNKFGLYDMYGNVWEWTSSCYTKDYNRGCYKNYKSLRGGSLNYIPRFTRFDFHYYYRLVNRSYIIGFRLARTK
jgi:formylglycine-generating enzyme required for sulfatase activity